MNLSIHGPTMFSRLCYFDAIARHGSITAAANELHLSQSAVSQRLRQLETAVGKPLFQKVGRHLELTEDGRALYEGTSAELRSVELTYRAVLGKRDPNELVLNCDPSIANQIILPAMSRFSEKYPAIRVEIQTCYDPVEAGMALRHKFDLAIRWEPARPGHDTQSHISGDRYITVCSPDLRDRLGLVEPQDLARAMLLYDKSPWAHAEPMQDWQTWCDAAGVMSILKPDRCYGFDLTHMAVQSAVLGFGVAIVPSRMVLHELASGQLVQPFALSVQSPGSYYAYLPATRKLPAANKFLKWFRADFKRPTA